ncbi:MAG: hypothetical protein QM831_39090 [Kofleriaceae bacterium]
MQRLGYLIAIAACAGSDPVPLLHDRAIASEVPLDDLVVRIGALKPALVGNRPGWEMALRTAELANDELGLPPFTQTVPPGPAWRPSPASLLGIAAAVQTRADELAAARDWRGLILLIADEQRRYASGIASVRRHLGEVDRWLAR